MTGGPGIHCRDPVLHPGTVGIRRVDVSDLPPTLTVTFVPTDAVGATASLLDSGSYLLTGGTKVHPQVVRADAVEDRPDQVLLTLDATGDFSVYTLSVVGRTVDPFFASYKLRFRLACDDPFDCRRPPPAVVTPEERVAIDYLAKDYAGFRQALLDFVPTRMPTWTERSEADVGIALLELFAATGDTLSYVQDRVANEAFLGSATQRRSVQNHLALLGYELDEGAAAFAWLQFRVLRRKRLAAGFPVTTVAGAGEAAVVFETLTPTVLHPEQNDMALYDWGNADCCLPRDATEASLLGALPSLQAGDHLLVAEAGRGVEDVVQLVAQPEIVPAGPGYGYPGALSLTVVRWSPLTPLHTDYCVADTVVRGNLVPATHGVTVPDERLVLPGPAQLAASQRAVVVPRAGPPGARFLVSAYGFADGEPVRYTVQQPTGPIGRPVTLPQTHDGGVDNVAIPTPANAAEGLWSVVFEGLESGSTAVARWQVTSPTARSAPPRRPGRLRVRLQQAPLAWIDHDALARAGAVAAAAPAGSAQLAVAPRSVPQLSLRVDGRTWRALPTLLDRGPGDEVFRIESEDGGGASLAFGRGGEEGHVDASFGRRPPAGSELRLSYRVGGGVAGNVGAETLTVAPEADPSWFAAVSNPRAANGGRDPETRQHARRFGPPSIHRRLVAVTAADYQAALNEVVDAAGRRLVSHATATFRWTGSWLTATLVVDPKDTEEVSPALRRALEAALDARRLAGFDLRLLPADYLPLRLDLRIQVAAGFAGPDVRAAVELTLGAHDFDGGRGFFHPENFSFGDDVSLSQLFQAVMAVPGVESVEVVTLAPLHSPDPGADTQTARTSGFLPVASDQIIRLDNDPNFPEHGRLTIELMDGR